MFVCLFVCFFCLFVSEDDELCFEEQPEDADQVRKSLNRGTFV